MGFASLIPEPWRLIHFSEFLFSTKSYKSHTCREYNWFKLCDTNTPFSTECHMHKSIVIFNIVQKIWSFRVWFTKNTTFGSIKAQFTMPRVAQLLNLILHSYKKSDFCKHKIRLPQRIKTVAGKLWLHVEKWHSMSLQSESFKAAHIFYLHLSEKQTTWAYTMN